MKIAQFFAAALLTLGIGAGTATEAQAQRYDGYSQTVRYDRGDRFDRHDGRRYDRRDNRRWDRNSNGRWDRHDNRRNWRGNRNNCRVQWRHGQRYTICR